MKKKLEIYKSEELRFIEEITERLGMLKEEMDSVYFPLKMAFSVLSKKSEPNLEIVVSLHGKNGWKIEMRQLINKNFGELHAISETAHLFIREIRNEIGNEIIQEGIRSINERK